MNLLESTVSPTSGTVNLDISPTAEQTPFFAPEKSSVSPGLEHVTPFHSQAPIVTPDASHSPAQCSEASLHSQRVT